MDMAVLFNFRAGTVRRTISREYFEHTVSGRAYQKWKSKESGRRVRNWLQAIEELGFEYVYATRDESRHLKTDLKAYEVYERRKDADALEDWCEAEREARQYYDVRDE